MQNLNIRKATLEDVEIIQNLNNLLCKYEVENGYDTYIDDWSLSETSAEYFRNLIQDQFVIVAEIEREIIGYLAGSIYNNETYSYYEGKTAELENMFVKEEFRKYGVGTKLVNTFVEWCQKK